MNTHTGKPTIRASRTTVDLVLSSLAFAVALGGYFAPELTILMAS